MFKQMHRPTLLLIVGLALLIFPNTGHTRRFARQSSTWQTQLIDPGSQISVNARGRGTPYINLRDGQLLSTAYDQTDRNAAQLTSNDVRPLAMTTADFDEDGTPDLICGYEASGNSLLTLHRGNVDAVYPNSPEARQRRKDALSLGRSDHLMAPFLSNARVFTLYAAPDFLGAGDFDADGHWDVVAAQHGDNALYFLPGDGRGSFGGPRRIELSGAIKTLATGEINRADGLTDIAVGIVGRDGPQVVTFEGPEGALRNAHPESFKLNSDAVALAFGQLDEDYPLDLAIASGRELLIVHGRDRKLTHVEAIRARVAPAVIDTHAVLFQITALALGNFVPKADYQTDIALLSDQGDVHLFQRVAVARTKGQWQTRESVRVLSKTSADSSAGRLMQVKVSTLPTDDLLLVDHAGRQIHLLHQSAESETGSQESKGQTSSSELKIISLDTAGRPIAALPMRLNVDALSDLMILTEGASAPSVVLTEPLVTAVVTNTNDSGLGSLRAALLTGGTISFDIPGPGPHIINVLSPLPVITGGPGGIGPVTIDGTTQPGFSGSPLIVLDGNTIAPVYALNIAAGSSVVRGLAIVRFNGDGSNCGITLATNGGNIVEGNYIGLSPDGVTPIANNTCGILINASPANLVGGTTAAARNVMYNNGGNIIIAGQQINNLVRGNYIGTNAAGTAGLSGSGVGVIVGGSNNSVGGTVAGGRNLISSVSTGIRLSSPGSNPVQGNYIGTDFSGLVRIGNGIGISTGDGNSNSHTIGGTTPAARNVIAGSNLSGVALGQVGGSLNNGEAILQGNYIGVGADGLTPMPNNVGVELSFTHALVGGTVSSASNLIAHNRRIGVLGSGALGFPIRAAILGNSIHSSTPATNLSEGVGLGIDLVANQTIPAVTPNDPGDADTGPNDLQNFPVLTSAVSSGGVTTILGSLNSTSSTSFRIEFFSNPSCDPTSHGEGKTYLGFTNVSTDVAGNASISLSLPVSVPGGHFITSTATSSTMTDPLASTSEFSQCIQSIGSRAHELTDYSGDGTSDLALFRHDGGFWFIRNTAGGTITTHQWGANGDLPAPADYDGDGRTDLAVFRPSNATWYILESAMLTLRATTFGISSDKPVAADFDGDGRSDVAVFRPSNGTWYILNSTDGSLRVQAWGVMEDKPVPADYDGDGRADIAVFRPSTGAWHIRNSNDNSLVSQHWGTTEDKPVAADYDGDGRADLAVWRPSSGVWFVLRSSNNTSLAQSWGATGDVPQPGDFDGDNRNDMIVWRPSSTTWYVLRSSDGGFATSTFGYDTDVPVSSPYRIE